jgi:serine/threonine protein kinase
MRQLGASDPREVGGYRVLAELGRGGMGRVLLGCEPDGRLVAVKLMRPQLVEDEGFRERFRREVDASRRVSGAYTASVIDADADAPTPWLASEFVPGPSLREAVDAAGGLSEESALRLAAGLAAALAEVHEAGLVHRDLKPSNVLLAEDGPRVIDFGIARAADSEGGSELTHTGWLVGSPGFMSPEQAEGRELTPASDMFSLGCVLVMACTGKGPFVGPSTPQTLYNVVHTEPDLSVLPDGVRRIAGLCLTKDPADRPTPAQLLEELAGQIAPAVHPWPSAVHELIARQHAEVTQLLDSLEEPTVHIHSDAATLAPTRLQFHPPFGQDDGPGIGQQTASRGTAVAGVPARRFGFIGVLVSLAVLVGVPVWAQWPASQTQSSSPRPASTTRPATSTTSSPALPLRNNRSSATSTITTTSSSYTKPDDGPYTAEKGDCFSDDYSSDNRSDLHRGSCVPGNFKVLKRVDGTTDASGECENVAGANWFVSVDAGDSRQALVLCTQYLYADEVFNGQAGQCAWGQADGSNWHIVECADHNFQILQVIRGTNDNDRCGDNARLRFSLGHSESRTSLSVVVCMTFRYGDDGAYAKINNCMLMLGSGKDARLVFADCAAANVYVTGFNPSKFDKNFCGNDGSHYWNDTGLWGKYLNYTLCWRPK